MMQTTTPPLTSSDDDPVGLAVQDPVQLKQLLNHALVQLNRFLADYPVTRRQEEADEVVQKTILRAIEKRTAFDPTRSIGAWLHGILLNVVREHCREVRKHAMVPVSPTHEPAIAATELADEEQLTTLARQLPLDDRNLVIWAIVDNLSHQEIGQRLNIRDITSRQRLHRLLNQLKREYSAMQREDHR